LILASEYKKILQFNKADTAWAILYLKIYDSLELHENNLRDSFLLAIINEERLSRSDTSFAILYLKALANEAYENGNDLAKKIKFLERIISNSNAFTKWDIYYKVWFFQEIGETYIKLNDNATGILYLKKFQEASNQLNDTNAKNDKIAQAYFGLGNAYRNAGNFDSALFYSIKAINIKSYKDETNALSYAALAEIYHDKKDYEKAELPALKALDFLKKEDETNKDIIKRKGVIFSIIADIAFAKKLWAKGYEAANNAIQNFDSLHEKISREKGKILLAYATAKISNSELDSALFYTDKAMQSVMAFNPKDQFDIPEKVAIPLENTVYEALDIKARIITLMAERSINTELMGKAVFNYDLAFFEENKLMHYFLNTNSTLSQLSESRQRSQKAINLCYQLYQLTKNNLWAEKAFQFAEKNKSFVLLESVKRNLASNIALQHDTLYQKAQSLQLQIVDNEKAIAEEAKDSLKTILQSQKAALENEFLFAKTALGRQSNIYKTIMEKEDSISAAMVSSSLLNEHTGLKEFFAGDSATYAFVLNKDLPIQFIKYNSTLNAEVDSLLAFFKSPATISNNPVGYQKIANTIYTSLGFEQMDKDWQNLIIIPDGKFSFVPFDALVTNSTNNINLQQANYFINKCNTIYGYSAQILLKQRNDRSNSNDNISVFAPVFANKENGQQPLLYSNAEANAVAENKNAQLFLKEKATLNNFKNQFSKAGILHFATHAYADTGSNSNPKIEFIDSSLLLNELYAMHTNASLVVLSACETGIGQLNKSEGAMSLARGFYYSGAKNVITSYWSVDDKSTSMLFNSFYKNIASVTSADALYTAKKEFLANATASTASPYYWAGFVHVGLPQKKEGANYWWWLLLLVPGVLFFFKKKKVM
jgi:CHAT domain-containing protein